MEIHSDFSKRVVVHSTQMPWTPSPMKGVERRMLDRIGGEVARATSIVRYAPGSHFSPHVHGGGEEFVVLEGTFQDEHGDYPVGTYVRNPPTSKHTPGSEEGCVIFVKLWQFDATDRTPVRKKTQSLADASTIELYDDARETVRIEHWEPSQAIARSVPEGAELLVLEGQFTEGADTLKRHAWLRLPIGARLHAMAGPAGARVWIKTRHLRFTEPPSV